MARAFGHSVDCLMKKEDTYGVQAVGDFVKFPYKDNSLGKNQGMSTDQLAGTGRDSGTVSLDEISVNGEVKVPVDMQYIGYFLTGLFGEPVTAGADPYVHTFKSGAEVLPSYSMEVGYKGPGSYEMNTGVMVDTMNINVESGGGAAEVSFALIGQANARAAASQGGAPITHVSNCVSNFQGKLKQGGAELAEVNSASFSYSNNLTPYRGVNGNANISGIDLGSTELSGKMSARFTDTDLQETAEAGVPVDLEFSFEISADLKVVFTLHECHIKAEKPGVSGAGGIDVDFSFTGVRNAAAEAKMTAVLTNNLPGATY